MELLPSPITLLEAGKAQPFAGRVNLLLHLLHALAYLHRRGFAHGDLKPDNVLVTQDGVVKVLDFGLALRAGQTLEMVAGTRSYMAPEMFLGQSSSFASDLYAVGIIAYELFAGRHPFDRQSHQFSYNVMYTPADVSGLGLDPSLAWTLSRLLAKTPAERPAGVEEVIAALSVAVGLPLPLETPATRESFLQAAELVGRDAELAQLTQAFKLCRWGQGSAWLVGGESGVGKSRLLDELRTRALVQGALVLRGQAVGEGGAPYQLWRESLRWLGMLAEPDDLEAGVLKPYVAQLAWLLERDVPDAPELDPRAAQTLLHVTVAALLRRVAAQQSVVIVLEDVHWADANSLELLNWLNRIAPELRLLILASYRDDERPRLPEELPGMTLLSLKRLSGEGVAALSEAMLGTAGKQAALVELLQRETEGNAFFIVEVVRALAEEAGRLDRVAQMALPEHVVAGGVQNVVQRRLSRVRPADRPLLELAAVAGRQLDMAILSQTVMKMDLPAWLSRCAEAAVLEPQGEVWRFAHDKFREALLDRLPSERKRKLHRRVALAIEAAYPNLVEHIQALAFHWGESGNAEKEAHYATLAGEQALHISAFHNALRYFRRALTLYDSNHISDDDVTPARLNYGLGEAYSGLGELREAQRYFQVSLDLARAHRNRKGIANALSYLGGVTLRLGEVEQAEVILQEALLVVREIQDQRALSTILNRLGHIANARGENAQAIQFYEESLALARASGDQVTMAMALNALGVVGLSVKTWEAARRYFEEAQVLFKATGNRAGVIMTLGNLGMVVSGLGQYVEAKQCYQEALTLSIEIGDRWMRGMLLDSLGDVTYALGDNSEAARYFGESLRLVLEVGAIPSVLLALAGIARLRARAGDPEHALELLGLALYHPACDDETRQRAEPLLTQLRAALSPEVVEAALERGKAKDLDAVVAEILA